MMQCPQTQHVTQPQQVVLSAQPQPVILQSHATSEISENYKSNQSKVLGIMQICCGCICSILGTVDTLLVIEYFYVDDMQSLIGQGIWCGLFFVLTGAFGIQAAKKKTKCMIVTFMVLSILSAVLAVILLIFGAEKWALFNKRCSQSYSWYRSYYYTDCTDLVKGYTAVNGLFVFLGLGEVILAIWSFVICCERICCGRQGVQGQVMQQNVPVVQYAQPGGQPQVVYVTSPQAGVAYAQQPGQVQQVVIPAGGSSMQPQQPPLQPVQQQNTGVVPPPYGPYSASAPPAEGTIVLFIIGMYTFRMKH